MNRVVHATVWPHGAYDPATVIAVLASHTIPGAETTDLHSRTHSRHLVVAGQPVAVTLHLLPHVIQLDVHNPRSDTPVEEAASVIRRWLDLDADLATIHSALKPDPLLAPLLAQRHGLRITGCPDPFEGAVMTVLSQHVSLAAARVFGGQLVALAGQPGALGLRRFPTAELLAALPPEALRQAVGLTAARARTVQGLAAAVAGGLRLDPHGDQASTRRDLLDLPGIGPWTVEYIALRCLGDRDAYPAGDRVLQRALDTAGALPASRAGESWRPYRAYATAHLWAASSSSLDHNPQ